MTTKRKPALMLTALLALALCLMLAVCVLTACNDGTDITSFDRLEAENRSPIPSEILAALYSYTMQQYESDNFPVTCIDYTKGLDPQRVLTKYPSHGAQATGYNDGFQGYFYNRTEKGLGVFGAIFNSEEEAKNYFIKVGGKFELPESAGSIYSDFTFTVQSNVILALASDIELQSFLDYDLSCLADFEKRAIDILFSLPEIEEYSVYAGIIAINENMQSLYPFEGNVLLEFIREVADNDGKGTSNMYKNDQALLLDQNVKDTVSEINNDNVYYNIDCYTEYSGNWIYSRVSSNPGIAGTLFYSPLGDPYYFIDFYYDENYRPTEVTIPSQINGIETKTIASFNGLPSFVTDLYLPGRDISVIQNSTIDDFRYEGDTTLLTIHGDDWVYQLGDGADNTIADIAILVPAADHGWMGAVLGYATEWAAEINAEGTYSAAVVTATSREPQMEQIEDIAAARTYKAVVILSIDSSVETSLRILAEADIPFIMVDRIIDGVEDDAVATVRGNDYQIGYLTGERFIEQGLVVGDNVLIIPGDNSNVSLTRTEGFYAALEELKGITPDNTTFTQLNPTHWARVIANREFADFINRTNDFADYDFIFTHDDEIAMGVIEALDGTEIDSTKKELFFGNGDEVVIASCGGLNEVYEILRGTSYADIYTNLKDLFDVTYPSSMIINALDMMVAHLDGETTDDVVIHSAIVDAGNVGNLQGYN